MDFNAGVRIRYDQYGEFYEMCAYLPGHKSVWNIHDVSDLAKTLMKAHTWLRAQLCVWRENNSRKPF